MNNKGCRVFWWMVHYGTVLLHIGVVQCGCPVAYRVRGRPWIKNAVSLPKMVLEYNKLQLLLHVDALSLAVMVVPEIRAAFTSNKLYTNSEISHSIKCKRMPWIEASSSVNKTRWDQHPYKLLFITILLLLTMFKPTLPAWNKISRLVSGVCLCYSAILTKWDKSHHDNINAVIPPLCCGNWCHFYFQWVSRICV